MAITLNIGTTMAIRKLVIPTFSLPNRNVTMGRPYNVKLLLYIPCIMAPRVCGVFSVRRLMIMEITHIANTEITANIMRPGCTISSSSVLYILLNNNRGMNMR